MTVMQPQVHPIRAAVAAANVVVAEVAAVDPLFMRRRDQADALAGLLALEARVAELKARLLVALDVPGGVVEETGARDLASWLAQQRGAGLRAARAEVRFAHSLTAHPATAAAMASGEVSQAQAEVIVAAVEALPEDLPGDLAAELEAQDEAGIGVAVRAERQLLADARVFDPVRLRVLGRRILEVVAPDIAEAIEARKLEAAERRASARVRLTLTPLGDGTTRVSGRIPDLAATRLRVLLDGLLSPRRTPGWVDLSAGSEEGVDLGAADGIGPGCDVGRAPPGPGAVGGSVVGVTDAAGAVDATDVEDRSGDAGVEGLPPWWSFPRPYLLGQAFCELLERVDPGDLPVHGRMSTTLFVTISLERLRTGLGAASVMAPAGEERISASEARRLACTSGLIPAVLGSKSELLDLGRSTRLFSAAQKKALMLAHPTCQAEGCDRPASHCEVHHDEPWSGGGLTDLANGVLLCNRDHHRAHDPELVCERLPDGTVVFTRP
jgi:hypothetical protein